MEARCLGEGEGREAVTLIHHSPRPCTGWPAVRGHEEGQRVRGHEEGQCGWRVTPGEALRVSSAHCSISDQLVPRPNPPTPEPPRRNSPGHGDHQWEGYPHPARLCYLQAIGINITT